ncbi:hypothetical protein MCAP1_002963 [Malassezia caprae]|uniref:Uncharacterized protein n=1 Tax=Malassezia caprae TaxID=1381934 RepID=A0AAF0E9Q3_9BASI|nr:hypothetical protein MCAP1_002963 [Malassezia caprae]
MASASLWSSDEAELNSLQNLDEHIKSVQSAGLLQEKAQAEALLAIESEQRRIEEALKQLDMCEQREAAASEWVLGPACTQIQYMLPLLRREDVDAIPILRAHAQSRRQVRALLSSPPWSARDLECLKVAVANEITRQNTMHGSAADLDWTRISMHVPYHTPADCRTRWAFHERPGLSHSRWGVAEKRDLVSYVERAGSPPWDQVATVLQPGRTGYQAFEMYQRTVKPKVEWTPEKDAALIQAVQELGPDWKLVAARLELPSTSATLCHQRHTKLKKHSVVMGRWSAAEDAALRAAVAQYGCDWKRVEVYVQGRTSQQCRERWVGRLANIPEGETQAVRRAWSKEEDERLRACVHSCKTWVQVANYVGGRTDKMVRERWLLLQRREDEEQRRKQGEPISARPSARSKSAS